ncbi:MAG: MBL fold metallo-hydrolase [Candidatus Lokiarchaeota archaeon]|nr:MBL fold metallo-hydrolase [Candidatus Lokiarchaeota archaeon]
MFDKSSDKVKNGELVIDDLFFFPEVGMLDCNQFIIRDQDTKELSLFDAGNGLTLNGLIEGMKRLGLLFKDITRVYITHEHVDHVLGLYHILKKMEDNKTQVFAYGETADILRNGIEEKIFPGSIQSFGINTKYFGVKIIPINITELTLHESIHIGSEFTFKIMHTPGHSPSSICYYEEQQKILIPGDLVFTGGSFGRYDFPGGSLQKLKESIKRVNELDVTNLLPGHMGITSQGNKAISSSFRMVQSIGSYF